MGHNQMKVLKKLHFACWLVGLFLLTACNQSLNLKVKSEVPIPLVATLPVTMGVYYDQALRNHKYTENSEGRSDWLIDNGESQVQFFDQVLPSMFRDVRHVETTSANDVDGVIVPHIADMQFALPNETKTDLYEAWIKYDIELFSDNGKLIAQWPVTGYGKSSTEFLKSKDTGLQTAINLALRDAGAKLALGFEQVRDVRAWLAQKTGDCAKYADVC